MQNMKKAARSFVACLTLVSFLGACTSTTAVRSSDPQARIYLDGEYKGQGIAYQTDSKIVGSSTSVRIEKEGCEPIHTQFSRSEELDVGALIAGIFFLIPLLWVMKYRNDHTFDYRCQPRR